MNTKDFEEVKTVWTDISVITKPNYNVYRIKVGGGRIYYTLDALQNPTFYISLTTLTKHTLPTSEHLIKWIAETGYYESKRYMNERANYGTMMHIAIGQFLINKVWSFENTEDVILGNIKEGAIDEVEPDEYTDNLNRDIAAFAQFCVEHKVRPYAIELVLVSQTGFATLIDLVCRMTVEEKGYFGDVYKSGVQKGKPKESKRDKEITALINFKSGKKGFYEENEIQLELEKKLFEENYSAIRIDKIFNWSPKDWNNSPTYNLKDQSNSVNREKADALLAIAAIELMKKTPIQRKLTGTLVLGETPQIKDKTIYDIVKERYLESIQEQPTNGVQK
jgi:hypothetical protein